MGYFTYPGMDTRSERNCPQKASKRWQMDALNCIALHDAFKTRLDSHWRDRASIGTSHMLIEIVFAVKWPILYYQRPTPLKINIT